jgi:hypothetical protein
MKEESINNYADIFMAYISKPPTLTEALEQLFNSSRTENSNEIIKDIIYESKTAIDRKFDKIKQIYPKISQEESMIITTYTLDSNIYRIINKTLNDDKKNIKNISKYLYLFIKSLRKLKKYSDSKYLYRGIRLKDNSLIKGNKKTFLTFISTSDNIQMAKCFAENGVIYILGDAWGYDITLFSYYEEKEILLEPERQFLIEEVISLNNTNYAKLKMLDTPLVLEDIIPVEINNINDLKNQLQNERRKNSDLNKIIKQLENKNKDYEQKINLLESELNQYKSKKENNEIQNASKGTQNINVLNAVLEKDKEIKELRLKLSRYPFQLEDGEKLISVIFISSDQKVHYSMICKNTTKFSIIEGKLYEEYKNYEELETYFTVNGKRINRHKSLDDNQIKNNDIIMLNVVDFE